MGKHPTFHYRDNSKQTVFNHQKLHLNKISKNKVVDEKTPGQRRQKKRLIIPCFVRASIYIFFFSSRSAFESQERRKRGQVLNKKKNFRHLSECFYGSDQPKVYPQIKYLWFHPKYVSNRYVCAFEVYT